MPTWPATLPQKPLAQSFRETLTPNVAVFQPDFGAPPITRRVYTGKVRIVDMSFNLDVNQRRTFLTFYEDTLKDGALAFDMPHPDNEGIRSFKFDTSTPVSFAELSGTISRVTFRLTMLPG